MPLPDPPSGQVAILLSTYNGARFLTEQLASFVTQRDATWKLHWRDDGSTDDSAAIVRDFAGAAGRGRCVEHTDRSGNVGVLASYMHLLRAVAPSLRAQDAVAFSDQDDVWLPDKLRRGLVGLVGVPGPALYCARYVLVDAGLRRLGLSAPLRRPPGMPQALTQNVATGCTILLNAAAAQLVAASHPPVGSVHDWWSYLVVGAAGGRVLRDETPVLLYRQHTDNAIGAAARWPSRALAAARRGPAAFMHLLRAHLQALRANPSALTAPVQDMLYALEIALRRPPPRLALLGWAGLVRQGWWETQLLRLWLSLG